jgi:UDP:flavonoid glycosyltransferase YjiC (YdhE family)
MIVTNELLFGCIIAAESAGIPCALLTGNLWCFPTRLDAPPFGPGFAPSNAAYARIRDHLVRRMLRPLYGRHTAALNRARADHGLPRLRNLLDQTGAATAIVLGVSRTFDIGDRTPPSPFFYAGPLLRIPVWAASNVARIDDAPDATPRVVVSFGTTEQGQARVIARCIRALARLPVSAIVTTGPAVRPQDLPVASNVRVVQSASHDEIVPGSAAMICHGGHGTLIRPIIHGVPLLCLPMGRDQYDNSARIVSRGAGLKLSARSGAGRIARAVRRLIDDPRFRQNAAALGRAVSDETDQGARAARHLIAVIQATAGAGRMAG